MMKSILDRFTKRKFSIELKMNGLLIASRESTKLEARADDSRPCTRV